MTAGSAEGSQRHRRRGTRRLAAAVLAVLVLGFVPSTASADPVSGPPSAATLTKITTFLDHEAQTEGLPGVAFTLVYRQSVLALRAVGRADGSGRPLTPHTPILLASLTKNLTATAVMQLVETGKVSLDAPVTAYLPWFRTSDPAQSAKITVADLLHHTSGIPTATPSEDGALDDHSPAALERGVRRLTGVRLVSEPGTTFLYANTNYNVLGVIVQTVSGEPFAEYLARHVFAPADMRDASVGRPPTGAAAGFYPWFGGTPRPTAVPLPGGMASSALAYGSAADLAQLLIMNLNDGQVGSSRILSPASVAALHRPAVAANDVIGYAMGWQVRPGWEYDKPTRQTTSSRLPLLIEHEGSWANTRTFVGFLPADKLGFAVLINANRQSSESELTSLYTGVWRILAGQEPVDYPATEPLLQQYGWQTTVVISALMILSFGWSIGLIRRTRSGAWSGTGPRISWQVAAFAAMLAFDLGVAALFWLYLPNAFPGTTYAIARYNPDIGSLMILVVVLLAWAPVRTVLAVRALLRRRER